MQSWQARALFLACAGGVAWGFGGQIAGAQTAQGLLPGSGSISEVRLIHADAMAVTQRPGEPQVFTGHVDVIIVDQQKREARLKAAKVTLFAEVEARQVDRIVAEGQVVLTREGMTARTELAVYDGRQGTVDLLQDNHVEDARGKLTADRIRVHLNTNTVSAEGNVRGVLFPQTMADSADGS